MEEVFINGKMEKFTMENGKMESNRVKEFGEEIKMIFMKVSGKIQKHKDLEFINRITDASMKANGLIH